jgi:phage repressor protein C with HTH and peptisase S24 domain
MIGNLTASVNGYFTDGDAVDKRSKYRSMLEKIVKRIEARLAATKQSAATASIRAGLSKDAIRNLQRAVTQGKQAGASSSTLIKLAPVLQTTAAWLIAGEGDENAPIEDGLRERPIDGSISVTGYVEAGKWFDVFDDQTVPEGIEVPAIGGVAPGLQKAFIVSGNSINKVAKPGDVLVCIDIVGSDATMAPDDLVIVERSRFGGQMLERTAKRVRKTATTWELWPESDDPRYQEPIIVNGGEEHEEIRICYKVIWIVRRP